MTHRLPPELLQQLEPFGQRVFFPRQTVIINDGDLSRSLFVILEGRVKAFLQGAGGREVVLSTQGPGEYFGEMVLDEGPRSASVMTLTRAVLLQIPIDRMRELIAAHPDFALVVIHNLILRARALTESVRSLALMDVYGRIARVLLELSQPKGDVRVIEPAPTQLELAKRVGASREMVSRILKGLFAGGYLARGPAGYILARNPTLRSRA